MIAKGENGAKTIRLEDSMADWIKEGIEDYNISQLNLSSDFSISDANSRDNLLDKL